MTKKICAKIMIFSLLFLVSMSAWTQGNPSLGSWSRISPTVPAVGDSASSVPFSFERLLPVPASASVSFSARVGNLVPGSAYVITLPYASGLSVSSQKHPSDDGGSAFFLIATTSEADVVATVEPGPLKPELSLRGVRVRSLSDASLALIAPWLLLTLLFAFSVTRVTYGAAVSVRDKSRRDETFFALAGLSSLLLLFAMFRYVSGSFLPLFPAELEIRLRAVGGIVFPIAVVGGIAIAKPFKSVALIFIASIALGAAATVASLLPFVPPALPMFAFDGAMAIVFIVVAAISFSARRRYEGVLAVCASFGAILLGLSACAYDPLLESIISCAAPLPVLLFSLRSQGPLESSPSAEPILSDYVDQVSIALTRFVPKEFLAILDKHDAIDLKLGDHVKKDMTIFFSDIRSFTTLSEGMTPEENFKFINSYLARVVPVVNEHGGFVDKYIGDAIMALFPEHTGADSAVRAAIEMQKRIVEYNGHRANCGYRPLSMGIGLHTGTLMLGVVGVEDRMQSTVISDAVNLASRLESITKVFNVSLAISEETFKSLADPGAYMYRFIGKVRVKGKNEPVSVFEIFDGINEEVFERKMKANRFFEQGMLAYYQKDFPGAMFYFRKVLEVLPEDGASTFYLDNCLAKARI